MLIKFYWIQTSIVTQYTQTHTDALVSRIPKMSRTVYQIDIRHLCAHFSSQHRHVFDIWFLWTFSCSNVSHVPLTEYLLWIQFHKLANNRIYWYGTHITYIKHQIYILTPTIDFIFQVTLQMEKKKFNKLNRSGSLHPASFISWLLKVINFSYFMFYLVNLVPFFVFDCTLFGLLIFQYWALNTFSCTIFLCPLCNI